MPDRQRIFFPLALLVLCLGSHWVKVTIDRRDPNLFKIELRILRGDR